MAQMSVFSNHPITWTVPPSFLCLMFLYWLLRNMHNLCSFPSALYFLLSVGSTKRGWGGQGWGRTEDLSAMLLVGLLLLAFCWLRVGSQWITGEQRHLVTRSECWQGLCLFQGPHSNPAADLTSLYAHHLIYISGQWAMRWAREEPWV